MNQVYTGTEWTKLAGSDTAFTLPAGFTPDYLSQVVASVAGVFDKIWFNADGTVSIPGVGNGDNVIFAHVVEIN